MSSMTFTVAGETSLAYYLASGDLVGDDHTVDHYELINLCGQLTAITKNGSEANRAGIIARAAADAGSSARGVNAEGHEVECLYAEVHAARAERWAAEQAAADRQLVGAR